MGLDTVRTTNRGFELIEFLDHNGRMCQLLQSSAIDGTDRGYEHPGSSFVWLGMQHGDRMHLDRDTVEALMFRLDNWLKTMRFDPPSDTESDAVPAPGK